MNLLQFMLAFLVVSSLTTPRFSDLDGGTLGPPSAGHSASQSLSAPGVFGESNGLGVHPENDTNRTTETIIICAGDSSLIFGEYEQLAGVYAQRFTDVNGHDSIHTVTLEVSEISISVALLRRDCGGANAGWGEVLFESDGRFEVSWSDGSFFTRNERLFAGRYTVTVTNEKGCTVSDTLEVAAAVPPNLQSYVIDESCPGANDGVIGLLTDRDELRFSLGDGPWLTGSTFRGLADGTYRVEIKDGDGCRSRVDFEVEPALTYVMELPEEIFIKLGDSAVIAPVTDAPPEEFRWKSDDFPNRNGCSELRLRPTKTSLVTATVGTNNECATTAQVRINVDRENLFHVPDTMNVGAAGPTSEFRIYPGQAVTHIHTLAVYDHWGNQVYLREDYAAEDAQGSWDGMLGNTSFPARGVYIYQANVELFTGEIIRQAGEVFVVR